MAESEPAPSFNKVVLEQMRASRARLSPPLSPRQREQRAEREQRRAAEVERQAESEGDE
jgi:hypothetical protein